MTENLNPLREIYSDQLDSMDDLKRYFSTLNGGDFSGHSRSAGLNLLDPATATKQTLSFREFHPLVSTLNLLLLDDANTSNYHCYVPDLPFPGTVLFMSHDGAGPKIVFESLDEMLEMARQALSTDVWLDELHQKRSYACPDQDRIDSLIQQQFDDYDEDAESVLHFLIKSSDLTSTGTFIELASDEDFDFAETIVLRILEIPSKRLLPIANACANSSSMSIAEAGARAVAAINAIDG